MNEEQKTPVIFYLEDGRVLIWYPEEPHLCGPEDVEEAVIAKVAEWAGQDIVVSPVGPFLYDPTLADPEAVWFALAQLGYEFDRSDQPVGGIIN